VDSIIKSLLSKKIIVWRYFLPVLIYLSFLIFLTLRADNELPSINLPYIDKVVHVLLFTLLSFLICRFLVSGLGRSTLWKIALVAFVFAAAYGAADEFLIQPHATGRHTEFLDYLCNLLGSAIGAGLTPAYRRWKQQRVTV